MKTLNYLFLTGLFLLFSGQKEQFTTDDAAAAGPVSAWYTQILIFVPSLTIFVVKLK